MSDSLGTTVSNGLDDRWLANAQTVADFVSEHGRFPTARDPGGMWLAKQRQVASHGLSRWTDQRQAWMDEHCPGWNSAVSARRRANDDRWLANAQAVADFLASHGRLPTWSEPGGRWLANQRQAARGHGSMTWTPERQAWLDEHLSGWDAPRFSGSPLDDDRWLANARQVAAFYAESQRFPTARDPGGMWLGNQRSAASGKGRNVWTPERQAWMDEHCPGWNITHDDRWLASARKVSEFLTRHGRFPKEGEPGAAWLMSQRQGKRNKRAWTDKRQEWLDKHCPGWETPLEDRWFANARAVADFVAEHERFPTGREPGGRWLERQRADASGKGRRRWSAERQEWLDKHCPGWNTSLEDRWFAQARTVADFVAEHERFPTKSEPGGLWLSRQRLHEYDWNRERQAWLDEHCPGWRGRDGRSSGSPV